MEQQRRVQKFLIKCDVCSFIFLENYIVLQIAYISKVSEMVH